MLVDEGFPTLDYVASESARGGGGVSAQEGQSSNARRTIEWISEQDWQLKQIKLQYVLQLQFASKLIAQ